MRNEEFSRIIEWSITDKCNYNCSYCIGKSDLELDKNIDYKVMTKNLVNSLKGSWEITLSGSGEPTIAKDFEYIVRELTKNKHYVGLITNLSLPIKNIFNICEYAGEYFKNINASLHPDQTDYKLFLEKIKKLKNNFKNIDIRVTMVAEKGKIERMEKIIKYYNYNNINVLLQRYIEKNCFSGFVEYSDEEKESLSKYFEMPKISKNQKSKIDKNNFVKKGRLCRAGKDYIVIGFNGNVWRCWSANECNDKDGFLGNINNGMINIFNKSKICKYDICSCGRPLIEGIVE
jgi:molybdenum cofactor biosynthesis enzyme MoaA